MEKRNLKRAIAKFEELANDDEYEGNRKIINLDAFLKGDLKKKKRKNPDHLESTPIKSSRDERPQQLSNSFDDPSDESSVEIKTADQFLKRFLSQPPLPTEDKMKKKKPTANKSTSKSISKSTASTKSTASNKSTVSTKSSNSSAAKRPVSSKQSTKSAASKSMITSRPSSSNRTDDRSLASKSLTSKSLTSKSLTSKSLTSKSLTSKSLERQSFGNRSGKSNQSTTSRMAELSRSKQKVQKDGDLKLKEREKQFLLMLQNRNSALDDEEEYDEEDDEEYDEEHDDEEELDDEELDDEELDDESAEESLEDETLDDESIDPENSELIDEHRLEQLREQQEFDDESIGDDHQQLAQEEMADEESEQEAAHYQKVNRAHQQSTSKLHGEQRRQSGLVKFDPVAKQQAVSQAICKVAGKSQSPWDYVTNFKYQQSATEELYDLVLRAEEYSFNILTKLIKNIKQTLDQDELPEPSRVKPFFHFTQDNQIHVTFLFVNPNEVYYTPWNKIISSNYSYLSNLFTKIYDIIFSFNMGLMKKGVHIRA